MSSPGVPCRIREGHGAVSATAWGGGGRGSRRGPPGALGDLAGLEHLALAWNALTGPVPAWLGRLAGLRSLHLGWNALTGPIPDELGSLTGLRRLELGGNALTGPIPGELGSLTNRPPAASGALPALALALPGTLEVDVSPGFADPDGDALAYAVSSSAPDVVTVRAAGARVTLTAAGVGAVTARGAAPIRAGPT